AALFCKKFLSAPEPCFDLYVFEFDNRSQITLNSSFCQYENEFQIRTGTKHVRLLLRLGQNDSKS
ncbi:MAG: hypothetical protein II114_05470, partial [Treponema sp.]|nr:hypothetical protein [Treponema sp.]